MFGRIAWIAFVFPDDKESELTLELRKVYIDFPSKFLLMTEVCAIDELQLAYTRGVWAGAEPAAHALLRCYWSFHRRFDEFGIWSRFTT